MHSTEAGKLSGDVFFQNITAFNSFGKNTTTFERKIEGRMVPFFVNEFWTSKQRAAHSLHEVSYRACFKPQLPKFFIDRLTNPGDTVYDPFMGRGTTLIEASLLGRNTVGNDVNPLSKILCGPRLAPPSQQEVEERLVEIDWSVFVLIDDNLQNDLRAFYHQETLNQMLALRHSFLSDENTSQVEQWIRMVATNRLTGHSPGFFSVYTLPPNQAVMPERQRKINKDRKQSPEAKDVAKIILKKSKSLLSKLSQKELTDLAGVSNVLGTGQADSTPYIDDESVDLIVTSPPFLDVVDYRTDNWLRCWFNGFDAMRLPISQLRKEQDWVDKMTGVFIELKRVLKSDGWIAFEVGEVNSGKVLLEELVIKSADGAGLKTHGVMINDQEFTKTANCWGVGNQTKGTNTNRIVLISK